MASDLYDVIVIGGGPTGSTLGSFLAMAGQRVLLLEHETFPRHQIGESLLPATVHGVCRMLGVFDEMKYFNMMAEDLDKALRDRRLPARRIADDAENDGACHVVLPPLPRAPIRRER